MPKEHIFRQESLKKRAVVFVAFVVLVFLSIAGWALHQAFANSFKRNAESAMQAQIIALLSALDIGEQGDIYFDSLPFPELNIPNSGVYAEIWRNQTLLWRSDSAIGIPLPTVAAYTDTYTFQDERKTKNKFLLSTLIEWQESAERIYELKFVSAVNSEPYMQQIRSYNRTITFWLLVLGCLLVLLQLGLFSWLFRPLSKLVDQLNEIEQGSRDQFDTNFPREIQGLTNSLNQYVQHERRQIAKQKDSLANLAHSLKTPIAVIKNAIYEQTPDKQLMEEQLQRIDHTIEYQLNKVNLVTRQRYRKGQAVAPDVLSLVNAMNKLNQSKGKSVLSEIDASIEFFGDTGDLLEVIGNLLENASKWAAQHIFIRLSEAGQPRRIKLQVIDDGPGIAADRRELVTQRGLRLDQKTEGHGIGLSIVADIIDSYGGSLNFADSNGSYSGQNFKQGLAVTVIL